MEPYFEKGRIMWTRNQIMFLKANGGAAICAAPALAMSGLSWGSNLIAIWTSYESLHRTVLGDVYYSHYHFDDDEYLIKIDNDLNVYLPTAERCLIDAVKFHEQSYDEGVFIEALQNYIRKNTDSYAKLYEVANHYCVPISDVNYWINEAIEESDMSMG